MIRLAQIGVGYWGKNILRNFASLDGVELAWVCDSREQVQETVKERYRTVQTTGNVEDIWSDDSVDAVVVAINAASHASLASQALAAGKHVFVEKPLTLDVRDGEKLVAQARAADRILMVGHLLKYHPAYLWMKEQIDAGALGDVRYLYSTRVNLGRVRTDENALWSLAPHDFSVMLMLLGEEPARVSATGHAYLQSDIEDVVFVTVSFPSGRIGHIHVSWLDPHKVRQLTVVGTKKMAVLDDVSATEKVRIFDHGVDTTTTQGQAPYGSYAEALTYRQGDISIPAIAMTEPLRKECAAFVEAISTGNPPPSDGADCLAVVKLLAAAQESLEHQGRPVELT